MNHRFHVKQDMRIGSRTIGAIMKKVGARTCDVAVIGPYGDKTDQVMTVARSDLVVLIPEGDSLRDLHGYYEVILHDKPCSPQKKQVALRELLEDIRQGFRVPNPPTLEWELQNKEIAALCSMIEYTIVRL